MKKLLSNKGSALVWAVCSMMVLTLIVAGILTLGLDYYKRSLDTAAEQRVKLLAQSGANYAVDRMTGDLSYISEVDVGVWMNIDGKIYDYIAEEAKLSGGKPKLHKNVNVDPVKVYFDGSVPQALEKWLKSHRNEGEYEIVGSDAWIYDEINALSRGEKEQIKNSLKGGSYAELYFSVQKANTSDETDTESFFVKVTSVASSGDYTAQCCANFVGMAFRDTNPDTGEREVTCAWEFLGFSET